MAVIEAKIKGIIDAKVRSKLKISTANNIAAIGALKIDDIAPAAAAPIKSVLVAWFKWKVLPKFDPNAAPVATVGPSSPTEPPKPTVIGAVIKEDHIWCLGSRLLSFEMA